MTENEVKEILGCTDIQASGIIKIFCLQKNKVKTTTIKRLKNIYKFIRSFPNDNPGGSYGIISQWFDFKNAEFIMSNPSPLSDEWMKELVRVCRLGL